MLSQGREFRGNGSTRRFMSWQLDHSSAKITYSRGLPQVPMN